MQISSRIRRHTCAAATAPGLPDKQVQRQRCMPVNTEQECCCG